MQEIETYLQQIELALLSSPVVASYTIIHRWANSDDGYIRVRATLINHDFLEAAEYFVLENQQIVTEDYRYQWMAADKKTLRRRWDNMPHHPGLPSFPHHIHDAAEENIVPGELLALLALIQRLETELS